MELRKCSPVGKLRKPATKESAGKPAKVLMAGKYALTGQGDFL
jgi:hypothetical protein